MKKIIFAVLLGILLGSSITYLYTNQGTKITRIDERFCDREGYTIFERTFIGNDHINMEIIVEVGPRSQVRFIGPSLHKIKLSQISEQTWRSRDRRPGDGGLELNASEKWVIGEKNLERWLNQ